jgi:acetolactate synthase I/II/III large subunit
MTTVAEVVADHLHAAGVRFAFGMPGGETVEVLDALRRRGIRFELVHDEASAVFMADAVARITGKPAVALTTLGPGATNATPGVAHAYLDRSPVIFITAQKPDALLPDYTHQVLDLHAIFAPITRQTLKVTAQNVATAVPQAIALAVDGRPGPIHLQISNEEAAALVTGDWGQGIREKEAKTAIPIPSPQSPIPDPLRRARRPVIIAGVGLEPEGPYDALRELAEAARAPVIVTPKAKGALSRRSSPQRGDNWIDPRRSGLRDFGRGRLCGGGGLRRGGTGEGVGSPCAVDLDRAVGQRRSCVACCRRIGGTDGTDFAPVVRRRVRYGS